MKIKTTTSLVVLLAFLIYALPTFCQTETATISGRVTDPSGAAVSGAEVQVQNVLTGREVATKTNASGLYVVTALQPGTYRVIVTTRGFKQIVKPDVVLNVQDNASLNFSMTIGSVSETITIEGGAPLLNTENASVRTVVDRNFVENIPLNGRSFQTLFQLTPGAVIANAKDGEPGQFSINGQRANANYFMVDGVSANVGMASGFDPGQFVGGSLPALTVGGGTNGLVSVDALQEFSIQTSTYAPEFGRTPGGQISILTRSGTNEFHGNLFDYLRNDIVDANDWFANNLGLKRAALRQNDFGGVIGGPIRKDKTFFFFSYEGLRLRQPTTAFSDVPTLAVRQTASTAVRPFFDAFPLPTGPDEGNGLAPGNYSFSNPSGLDAASLRIDHRLGQNLTLFARYNRSTSNAGTRGSTFTSLNSIDLAATKLHTFTAGVLWAIHPTLGNDLHFNWSWSRFSDTFANDGLGGAVPISLETVLPGGQDPAESHFLLQIFGGNHTALIYGPTSQNLQRQINFIDILSWQKGGHLIKGGVDYRRLMPQIDEAHYGQQVGFNTAADLAVGSPTGGVFIANTSGQVDITYTNYSIFVQDDWKATPRLTLTYGARWDYNPAPSARAANGFTALTVVGIDDLANLAPAPAGTPLYHATVNNVAPRLGFAYNIRDSRNYGAVLRSGFGVFYDLGNGQTGNIYTGFPFVASTFAFPQAFPLSAADAAGVQPSLSPPFGFMFAFPSTLRQPYTYHWNLTWEQAMGPNQSLTLGYVGAAGHSLIRQDSITGGQLSPNFSAISYINNLGYSHYNALQVELRRRQAKKLELLASYTWAHPLDNVSADSTFVPPNPVTNYGSADFDIRHTGSLALDYTLPSPARSGWQRAILGNWAINTLVVARTAPPVDVTLFQDLGVGFGEYRPDVVPGVAQSINDPSAPGGRRLNPAAFSLPPARQGNLGRNSLRGFSLFQQDLSVRRSFRFNERFQLQARIEAFNLFNHPNFASPQRILGFESGGVLIPESNFGISQAMFATGANNGAGFNPLYQVGGPRSLQAALKLEF